MVGRKRKLRPHSQNKLAVSIVSSLAGRMGPVAESPLGSFLITTMAMQSAAEWYEKRAMSNTILRNALGKLGAIPPIDHAKVNALVGAATKVILSAREGTLTVRAEQALEETLDKVAEKLSAPRQYVDAVKEAALAFLGQPPAVQSQ